MAKRPVPKYDFKAFGAAIKAARTGRKESRKKVSDEMFISPRYLANIENKGQHPSLQIFFELMLRYNISVDQFLLETPPEKNTQRLKQKFLLIRPCYIVINIVAHHSIKALIWKIQPVRITMLKYTLGINPFTDSVFLAHDLTVSIDSSPVVDTCYF